MVQTLVNKGLCHEWCWISDWMYHARPCDISCKGFFFYSGTGLECCVQLRTLPETLWPKDRTLLSKPPLCVRLSQNRNQNRKTTMSASYKKLWKILIDRDMNKSDLIRQAKITSNIVAKMGKGEDVSMESLRKICIALNCEIGDIMEVNAGEGEK